MDVAGEPGEEGKGATTPEKLRNSILANRGIMQPIIVNRQKDGRLVCIEGNTRLYINRQFQNDGVEGDWSTIPAIVHDCVAGDGVNAIRLQAHLVGPRAWDAYSKAKYQWELHNKYLMPLDRLVDLCGGSKVSSFVWLSSQVTICAKRSRTQISAGVEVSSKSKSAT